MASKLDFVFTLDKHTSLRPLWLKLYLDEKRTPGDVDDDVDVPMKQKAGALQWDGSHTTDSDVTVAMGVQLAFGASTGAKWHLKVTTDRAGKKVTLFDAGSEVFSNPSLVRVELMQ
jgi:hypothetical protein